MKSEYSISPLRYGSAGGDALRRSKCVVGISHENCEGGGVGAALNVEKMVGIGADERVQFEELAC